MSNDLVMIFTRDNIYIDKRSNCFSLLFKVLNTSSVVLPYKNISQLDNIITDLLVTLTPREEKVLRLRFGLDDGKFRTLQEVGDEFNRTGERIRQIEEKALRKLRDPSRTQKALKRIHLHLKEKSIYDNNEYLKKYKHHLTEIYKNDIVMYNNDYSTLENTIFLKKKFNRNNNEKAEEVLSNNTSVHIKELDFSVRVYNCLTRSGICYLNELLTLSEDNISNIRNLGERGKNEVIEFLNKFKNVGFIYNSNKEKITTRYINLESSVDSLDKLFNLNIPINIIYTLLTNGYYELHDIFGNYEIIYQLLKENNIDSNELFSVIDDITSYAVVMNLDVQLLNYLTMNNIKNMMQLEKIVNECTNEYVKEIITYIIENLNNHYRKSYYDTDFIKENNFRYENDIHFADFEYIDEIDDELTYEEYYE